MIHHDPSWSVHSWGLITEIVRVETTGTRSPTPKEFPDCAQDLRLHWASNLFVVCGKLGCKNNAVVSNFEPALQTRGRYWPTWQETRICGGSIWIKPNGYIWTLICVCIYIYIFMYLNIHIYIYIYTHRVFKDSPWESKNYPQILLWPYFEFDPSGFHLAGALFAASMAWLVLAPGARAWACSQQCYPLVN